MHLKSGLLIVSLAFFAAQSGWNDYAIHRAMDAPATLSCKELLAQKEPVRLVKVNDCVIYHGAYAKSTTSVKLKRTSGKGAEVGSSVKLPLFATREDANNPAIKARAILSSNDAQIVKATVDGVAKYNELSKQADERIKAIKDASTPETRRRALQAELKGMSQQLDTMDAQMSEVRPLTLKLVPGEDFTKLDRIVPEQYVVYEAVNSDEVPGFWASIGKLVGGALFILLGLVWLVI